MYFMTDVCSYDVYYLAYPINLLNDKIIIINVYTVDECIVKCILFRTVLRYRSIITVTVYNFVCI